MWLGLIDNSFAFLNSTLINLQSLQDVVARFTSMDFAAKEMIGAEDGSHIFEVRNFSCDLYAMLRE